MEDKDLFEKLRDKYHKRAQDNMPQIVYAPPDIMWGKNKNKDDELNEDEVLDLDDKYNINPWDNMPREVYGTPDTMRAIHALGKELLFGYSKRASYGLSGNPNGFSITVYSNGEVIREDHVFGSDEGVKQPLRQLTETQVERIVNLMIEHVDDIDRFKNELTVMDGTMYKIQFGKKIIRRDDASFSGKIKKIVDDIMVIVLGAANNPNLKTQEKYDIKPNDNNPRKVYGVPKPRDDWFKK